MNNCETINVDTGEVKIGFSPYKIISNALGSCVAVIAYDTDLKIGAIAHVMLPGEAPKKEALKNKYAVNAINYLFQLLNKANCYNPLIFLVGGGNVLKRKDSDICEQIISSVKECLLRKNIPVTAESLGGFERRTVALDTLNGIVYYSIGDGKREILWEKSN